MFLVVYQCVFALPVQFNVCLKPMCAEGEWNNRYSEFSGQFCVYR